MQECREDLPGSGAAGSEDEHPARRSHSVFSLFLFCFGFSCSFLPLLVFLCYSSLLCVSTVLCFTLSVFPLFRLSHLLCVFFSGSWPVRPLFFFSSRSLSLFSCSRSPSPAFIFPLPLSGFLVQNPLRLLPPSFSSFF